MASELKAARQEMMKASYKLDVVQRWMGDLQKQMNRMEVLLQGLVNPQVRATNQTVGRGAPNLRPSEEPRNLSDLVQPAEVEMEITRRIDEPRRINLNSTQGIQRMGAPEGNFNFPLTGYSVATGWGQDYLPNASLRGIEWGDPKDPDEVFVKYEARLEDGTTVLKSEGVEFTVKDGLDCAVLNMKKGEVALVTIPPKYAIGSTEAKQDLAVVPPNSTLIYEVELVSFVKDKESVYALVRNDTGTLLVFGGTEKVVRVWDPGTGLKNIGWRGHTDNIRVLLLDATGRAQPKERKIQKGSAAQLSLPSTFGTASRSFRALRETVAALPVEGRMLCTSDVFLLPDVAFIMQSLYADEEFWDDFDSKMVDCIRNTLDRRVQFYEEEICKLSEQRFSPIWNFCNFFILKESLAFMFEMTNLHENSLREYDELELCYSESVNSLGKHREFGGWDTDDDQAALLNPGFKALTQIVQDDVFR